MIAKNEKSDEQEIRCNSSCLQLLWFMWFTTRTTVVWLIMNTVVLLIMNTVVCGSS